jgi:hypothetical protein
MAPNSNFWKPVSNFFRGVQTAAPARNPIARGNSSGGWGDAMRLSTQVVPRLANIIDPNTGKPIDIDANALRQGDAAYLAGTSTLNRPGTLPSYRPGSLGGGGGGGRGGGGGGGGAAAPVDPTMTQGMFDWLMGQFGGGPQSYTPTTLDLPDYSETFDPTMYTELEGKLGTAAEQDRGSANAAYDALGNYLQTNYSNAFTNPNNTYATAGQAPGTTPEQMAEMARGQGVDPTAVADQTQGAAAADQGFANLWRVLAANEDTAQRNRLNRVQTDRGTTSRGIDAAVLGGKTGIGMARNRAEQEMKTRVAQMQAQIAQQEAMANWTAQQEASQFNASNANSFQSQRMQAMLGLVPELVRAGGGITLPGQRPSFHTTAQDPLGWASIAAAQEWDRTHGGAGGGGGPPPRPTFQTTPQDPKGWASIAAAQEWDRQYGGG